MRRTVCILLSAMLWVGCAAVQREGEVVPVEAPVRSGNGKVEVGRPYIDFTAPALGGGEIRLGDLVGDKVVVLQFWGIRCSPCLEEMAFLSSLQARYADLGLQVVGVNTDRLGPAELTDALATRQIEPPYPIVRDPDFAVAARYTHWLIPVTVVIDRGGLVRAVHTGYRAALDLRMEEEVQRALGR